MPNNMELIRLNNGVTKPWEEYKANNPNAIFLKGRVVTEPLPSFKTKQGEQFYQSYVASQRLSGHEDTIPVVFSVADVQFVNDCFNAGVTIALVGTVRTQYIDNGTKDDGTKRVKLVVNVLTRNLWLPNDSTHYNDVNLLGRLGRISPVRTTPNGLTICDFSFHIHNTNRVGKDYVVPSIAWNSMAKWVAALMPGNSAEVKGRLQSRQYTNSLGEEHTTLELSVYELSIIEDDGEDSNA